MLRKWIDLVEAKFRQPHLMYHGTSSAFLPSILKQGLLANPRKKNWDTDSQESESSFSRASLAGSYWTSNFMTASSSATSTLRKFPGDEIILIGQIAEQSAYADEDNINAPLMWAVNDVVQALHPQVRPGFWLAIADDVFGAKRSQVQSLFAQKLHVHLKGGEEHVPDRHVCDEVLDTLILRSMAFEKKNGMRLETWVRHIPEIPSIADLEHRLLQFRDQLTRSYRSSAFHAGQFNHTLRVPVTVGFSGANRINWILRFKKWHWDEIDGKSRLVVDPITLVYGAPELPEDFLSRYRQRVGKFPGLNDTAGHVLLPSERSPESDL